MFSSTLTTLITLLATSSTLALALPQSSPAPPPINHDTPDFKLRTIAINGNRSFSDLYLSSFHTGAAQNAVVGLRTESQLSNFFLNSTYLNLDGATYPYSIGLSASPPYNSTAPAGYNYVSLDVGAHTPGFRLVHNGIVIYRGADVNSEASRSFAVCFVNGVAPYQSVGPQYQLLWRPRGVATERDGSCADVLLQAVFV